MHPWAAVALSWLLLPSSVLPEEVAPVAVEIRSGGATMQGKFFRAECEPEPSCPTLLLVPGWPGNPNDVLGMGGMLHEDGIHVLMFNPRGLHESEGTMTFSGALDDIGAALDWLTSDGIVERFAIDTSSVVLGGYSFGGGMAMAYAARDPRVRALISFAGTDHGVFIRLYQADPAFAEAIDEVLQSTQAPAGPARSDSAAGLKELAENQAIFGLQENAAALADRSILLIGGWEDSNTTVDDYMLPLYRALRAAGAEDVRFLVYHDDHAFRQVRRRLADDVRDWIRGLDDERERTGSEE